MANPAGRAPWKRPGLPAQKPGQTMMANSTPRMGQAAFKKGRKGNRFANSFGKNTKYKGEKPYGKKGKFFA